MKGKLFLRCKMVLANVTLISSSVVLLGTGIAGAVELHMISHRHPGIEFYAEVMGELAKSEGVTVFADLMPGETARNIMMMNLAAGSSAYDIAGGLTHDLVKLLASRGWLEPLDAYIDKYKEEYGLDLVPENIWDALRYEGKIYAIPSYQNTMFFFYRQDLFDKYGLTVPKTFEEYVEVAKKLTREGMYGTGLALKRPYYLADILMWMFQGHNAEWFDDQWKPIYNSADGLAALKTIGRLLPFSPPDVLAYGNDEAMVGMQQGLLATTHQWGTRAGPMDDPSVSKVIGLVGFAPPPHKPGAPAGSSLIVDGYTIPVFAKHDKELIFRTIARLASKEAQERGAESGVCALPIRTDVLSDPQWVGKNRYWPAVMETIKEGATPYPVLPEWGELARLIEVKVSRALAGEMESKEALDLSVQEIYEFLKEKGYYETK